MNTVKTNIDQFLGKIELQRIISSLGEFYIQYFIKMTSDAYGIIKNRSDSGFLNLKVIEGSSPDYLTINPGFAIDKYQRFIFIESALVDEINVPNDATDYYVYIKSFQTSTENGYVSISATGQLTGINTEFTKTLRGGANYNSKIKFPNATQNTNEYEISSVTNDTVAQIAGSNFVAESSLRYKVIGTFSLGKIIDPSKKDIFQYDKYEIIFSANDSLNVTGEVFKLARVNLSGGVLTVTDLRTDLYFTNADSKIGDLIYDDNNHITDDEPITESLNKLDKAIVFTDQSDAEDAATESNPLQLPNTDIVTPRSLKWFKDELFSTEQFVSNCWFFKGSPKYFQFYGNLNTEVYPGSPTGLASNLIPTVWFKSEEDTLKKRINFVSQAAWNDGFYHHCYANIWGGITGIIKQVDQSGIGIDGLRELKFRNPSFDEVASIKEDSNKVKFKGLLFESISVDIITNLDFVEIYSQGFTIIRVSPKFAFVNVDVRLKTGTIAGSLTFLQFTLSQTMNLLGNVNINGTYVNLESTPDIIPVENYRPARFKIYHDKVVVYKLDGVYFVSDKYYNFVFSGMIPLINDYETISS